MGSTVFTDKPVAWINIAADVRRGEGAHTELATVLGYLQARVLPVACTHVPLDRYAVDAAGLISDKTTVHAGDRSTHRIGDRHRHDPESVALAVGLARRPLPMTEFLCTPFGEAGAAESRACEFGPIAPSLLLSVNPSLVSNP